VIIVFQTTIEGWSHVPINQSLLQSLAHAYPQQQIHFFGSASHIAELNGFRGAGDWFGRITMHAIDTPPLRAHPTEKLWKDGWALSIALAKLYDGSDILLVLPYTTGELVRLVSFFQSLRYKRVSAAFVLHGNANEIFGWQSRNPLYRWLALGPAIRAANARQVFLVLDQAIQQQLVTLSPDVAARIEVWSHPVNSVEAQSLRAAKPQEAPPYRFGFLGVATLAKGIDVFGRIAADICASLPGRATFQLLGRVHRDAAAADLKAVAFDSGPEVPRDIYLRDLASLHYAVFPFRNEYYSLSASGTLLDAIAARKPIITTSIPLFRGLFEEFGDVGYLCSNDDELRQTILSLASRTDPDVYSKKQAALERALIARSLPRTADELCGIFERRFSGSLRT
jgi:glycosyltransferase involved in cell wall biosynthesis